MSKNFKKKTSIWQWVLGGSNALGVIIIFAITGLMLCDIMGRVFLGSPILGTYEAVGNALPAICFLMIANVLYKKRHIEATILSSRFPPYLHSIIQILNSLLGCALFVLVIVVCFDDTVKSVMQREFEGSLTNKFPVYPTRVIILVGSAMMAIQYIVDLVKEVISMLKKRSVAESDLEGSEES